MLLQFLMTLLQCLRLVITVRL